MARCTPDRCRRVDRPEGLFRVSWSTMSPGVNKKDTCCLSSRSVHRECHVLGWPHSAGIDVTAGSFRLNLEILAVLLSFASRQQTVSRRSPFASQTLCRMIRQTIITSQSEPDVTLTTSLFREIHDSHFSTFLVWCIWWKILPVQKKWQISVMGLCLGISL